jgi:hypothetical protein
MSALGPGESSHADGDRRVVDLGHTADFTVGSQNPNRLADNNRAGRKAMQAYFRQRGVAMNFSTS